MGYGGSGWKKSGKEEASRAVSSQVDSNLLDKHCELDYKVECGCIGNGSMLLL